MVQLINLVDDFIDAAYPFHPCQDAKDWLEAHRGMTVEAGCAQLVEDENAKQAWAVWTLLKIREYISTGVQVAFARKISDPMIAYRLHIIIDDPEISLVLNPIYSGIINETL